MKKRTETSKPRLHSIGGVSFFVVVVVICISKSCEVLQDSAFNSSSAPQLFSPTKERPRLSRDQKKEIYMCCTDPNRRCKSREIRCLMLCLLQRLLYHRTCTRDFLCSWPLLNSYLKYMEFWIQYNHGYSTPSKISFYFR